jgi:hypothetical protein
MNIHWDSGSRLDESASPRRHEPVRFNWGINPLKPP